MLWMSLHWTLHLEICESQAHAPSPLFFNATFKIKSRCERKRNSNAMLSLQVFLLLRGNICFSSIYFFVNGVCDLFTYLWDVHTQL